MHAAFPDLAGLPQCRAACPRRRLAGLLASTTYTPRKRNHPSWFHNGVRNKQMTQRMNQPKASRRKTSRVAFSTKKGNGNWRSPYRSLHSHGSGDGLAEGESLSWILGIRERGTAFPAAFLPRTALSAPLVGASAPGLFAAGRRPPPRVSTRRRPTRWRRDERARASRDGSEWASMGNDSTESEMVRWAGGGWSLGLDRLGLREEEGDGLFALTG